MNNSGSSKGIKLNKRSSRRCSVPNPQVPYDKDIISPSKQPLNDFIITDSKISSSLPTNRTPSQSPVKSPQRFRSQSSISKDSQSRKLKSKKNADNLPPLANSKQNSAVGSATSSRSYLNFQTMEKYLKYESVLEAFLVNTMAIPLHAAIEQTIKIILKADTVTYWQDIPSLHMLYSNRISTSIDHSSGLVGYTFYAREIVKSQKASSHHSYNHEIDSKVCSNDTPVLLFPLWDSNSNVCGVVEVTRDVKSSFFENEDDEFIQFFIKKFQVYSYWLFKVSNPSEFCLELLQIMEPEQFLLLLQKKMTKLFDCNRCEIWKFNTETNEVFQYYKNVNKIEFNCCGIAGESMTKECLINCSINKMQSSYHVKSDGIESESVLVVPLIEPKMSIKYAVVLRGKKKMSVFTDVDEKLLREISPYIILSLENDEKYSLNGIGGERNKTEKLFVSCFKKIVENISNGKKINEIVNQSMEAAVKLVNSDRSLLFSYNSSKKELEVIASTGVNTSTLKKNLTISSEKGVVGKTFNTGKTYNIPDVYDNENFDSCFDLLTQYKTRSLISVPVYNNRRKVIGVAQFMNKKDGKPFSNSDISNVDSFMTFCGMLMENDRLFNESSMAEIQLKCFVNALKKIVSNEPMKNSLVSIVENAKLSVGADRSTLFFHESVVSLLSTYITDEPKMPSTIPLNNGIAATSVLKRKSIIVNDAYHDAQFNKMVDFDTKYKTNKVIVSPIISVKGKIYGVLEMVNKKEGNFTDRDLMLLDSFANIASSVIENNNLIDICERGASEVEIIKWIGDLERSEFKTPSKLIIASDKVNLLHSFSFNAIEWNGIGLFKIAFYVFNEFHLLEKFNINNGMFFTFLYKLRECYKDVPFHNWIHAIDVLQLYSQQIKVSHFDEILTGLELLAICVASIAIDVGHHGFDNDFHIKAKTPFGIMYKEQKSVTEIMHCSTLIRIINSGFNLNFSNESNPNFVYNNNIKNSSEDYCNIFHSLTETDQMKIWSWIIDLITSTDIANNDKFLKKVSVMMDEGPINLSNEKHRIIAMILLMKISNLTNVLRPFDIAQQWTDALMEEFWKQGDVESELGLELSNQIEDRKCNKEKLQISFIQETCIPLFQIVTRIFPELEVNEKAAQANIEGWKEKIEEKEKK